MVPTALLRWVNNNLSYKNSKTKVIEFCSRVVSLPYWRGLALVYPFLLILPLADHGADDFELFADRFVRWVQRLQPAPSVFILEYFKGDIAAIAADQASDDPLFTAE